MKNKYAIIPIAASLIMISLLPTIVLAEEKEDGWKDVAEFSWVQTAGNSETSTFGLKNKLSRSWNRSSVKLKTGGIRANSTTETVSAYGDPVQYFITSETTTTAESYYLNGRYDRKITEQLFWYAGAGWDRNQPAGIQNRYIAQGGVGNIWFDTDDMKFRTDYAVTYTDQEDVFEQAGDDTSFFGARVSWEYMHKFGKDTTYENLLVLDANLEESSDYRADMINALSVSINSHLALKVSLQWLYDNDPAFGEIPLYDLSPDDPAAVQIGTAPYELDNVDTLFTASLVMNF